ncbi:MAG: HNH endonuclease [Sphingomicrobium sp.]
MAGSRELVVIHPRMGTSARRRCVRALRKRDGDACCWCRETLIFGGPALRLDSPTIEHIISRRLGGSHDLRYLRLAHFRCNIWYDQGRLPTPKKKEN